MKRYFGTDSMQIPGKGLVNLVPRANAPVIGEVVEVEALVWEVIGIEDSTARLEKVGLLLRQLEFFDLRIPVTVREFRVIQARQIRDGESLADTLLREADIRRMPHRDPSVVVTEDEALLEAADKIVFDGTHWRSTLLPPEKIRPLTDRLEELAQEKAELAKENAKLKGRVERLVARLKELN